MKSRVHPLPRLVVIEGNEKGKVFTLKNGAVTLGRSKSDIVISDPRISREHVRLEFDEESGQLLFTDLKSLNGTQINGGTLTSGILKDGDKLQIGNTIIDCQLGTLVEFTEELRKEPVLKTEEVHLPPPSAPTQDKATKIKEPAPAPKPSWISTLPAWSKIAAGVVLVFVLLSLMNTSGPESRQISQSNLEPELSLIRQMLSRGENQKALERALEVSAKNPAHPELDELLGDLYFSIQKLELAIRSYKAAFSHETKSQFIYFKLTKAYMQAGLVAQASEQLVLIDKLIQNSPKDKDLFIQFADLLLKYPELNQSFDRALILSKALQKEVAPQSTIGYRLEAATLLQQKKVKEAASVYEKALAIAPTDQDVLESLTMVKLNLQDMKGAMQVTEQWLKQNPNEVRALLAVAYLKFYERDYLGTIPHLQTILNLLAKNPTNSRRLEALHLMGLVFWEQGQRTEAETYLSESCKLGYEQSCKHQLLLTQPSSDGTPSPAPLSQP